MTVGAQGRRILVFQVTSSTLMAQSSVFASGKTFASRSHITFGSPDILATATGELHLVDSDVSAAVGMGGPTRSATGAMQISNVSRCMMSSLSGALTGSPPPSGKM
jgi:hypothetical protein